MAEEFLGMKDGDRDKVRRLGPITAAALKRFHILSADPFSSLAPLLKTAKAALRNKPKKNEPPVQVEAIRPIYDALGSMVEDPVLSENARLVVSELMDATKQEKQADAELKRIGTKIKEFKKSEKDRGDAGADASASESGE